MALPGGFLSGIAGARGEAWQPQSEVEPPRARATMAPMSCLFRRSLVAFAMLSVLLGCASSGRAQPQMSFASDIQPLLQKYCWDCHGDGEEEGGLNLDAYQTEADLLNARKKWESVIFNIDNWLMPPVKKKQPTAEERALLVRWIDDTVFPVDPANPDPGRVTIRRLNKTEYNNTARDLLGVDVRPADNFPDDDSGYGFDNIGDVLAMPPSLVERYLQAATLLLDTAVVSPDAHPRATEIPRRQISVSSDIGGTNHGTLTLWASGEARLTHDFPAEARYRIRLHAHAEQAGDELVKLALRRGDEEIGVFDISGTREKQQTVEAAFTARPGSSDVRLAFLNDFSENGKDRNLYIESLEIIGPIWTKDTPLPESHRRIFIHDPGSEDTPEATRKILGAFASRAYRRPAQPAEVDKLAALAARARQSGRSWEDSVKMALKAALVSPYFLYRIEWQADPSSGQHVADLSEFALASRLSYFLWSSMPDEALLARAAKNELRSHLADEIRRMIADPKARELSRNFGGQWLETRNLEIAQPDREKYRDFDRQLRTAMQGETEEFFHYLLTDNRSVLDFIGADYTFVNERLARHYGIEGVEGREFQKVHLEASTRRRGLLTHASILTVTSDPTRTSPVKRGKWVLENLLGTPPPPPPPNIPSLDQRRRFRGTLRQRLEQHRENPACANCHAMLDPIGFGLENFDGIGSWRDQDGNAPVDSAGRLTTGQEFQNAAELTEILLRDKSDQFTRNLAAKLLTFALGRGVEYYDKPALAEIMAKTKKDNHAFQSLIIAIAESVPFQKRRAGSSQNE